MTLESEQESATDKNINGSRLNLIQQVNLLPGEYLLTPLQVLIINKTLKAGFKIELEEHYVKYTEPPQNFLTKKRKHVIRI